MYRWTKSGRGGFEQAAEQKDGPVLAELLRTQGGGNAMFWDVLDKPRQSLLKSIVATPPIPGAYLAGGTALALQYGQPLSEDFDWFCPKASTPGNCRPSRTLRDSLRGGDPRRNFPRMDRRNTGDLAPLPQPPSGPPPAGAGPSRTSALLPPRHGAHEMGRPFRPGRPEGFSRPLRTGPPGSHLEELFLLLPENSPDGASTFTI